MSDKRKLVSRLVMLTCLVLVVLLTACGRRIILDDSSEEIGLQNDLVMDSQDHPRIAYFDKKGRMLKLAVCMDPKCGDAELVIVDNEGAVGQYPSLVLDDEEKPIMSYYDMAKRGLKIAFCQDTMCGEVQYKFLDTSNRVGEYSSLVLSSKGFPMVSYYDSKNKHLKLAVCQDAMCNDVGISVVDDTDEVGKYTSLALLDGALPVISYYDENNSDLKIAMCADATCTNPVLKTLDGGEPDAGEHNTLLLRSDGSPIVSYEYYDSDSDPSLGALKLAICQDPMCDNVTFRMVDEKKGGRQGEYGSMMMNSEGHPVMGYWDSSDHSVRIATCKDADCDRVGIRTVAFDWGAQYVSVAVNSKDKVFFSCYEVRPTIKRLVFYRSLLP